TTRATQPPIADATPAVAAPAPAEPPVTTTPLSATPTGAPTVDASSGAAPRALGYAVQAGAFSDPARAESLRAALQDLFAEARVVSSNGRTPPLWRVIVGREMTREQAAELA